MRSSVLFWYWQILWRATIPSQYLWGFLTWPFFRNSLWGPSLLLWAFLLMSLHLHKPPGWWWPGWPPYLMQPHCLLPLLSSSFCKGTPPPGDSSLTLPLELFLFVPFWNGKATNCRSWQAVWGCVWPLIFKAIESLFLLDWHIFWGRWQRCGIESQTSLRGRAWNFKKPWGCR